MAHRRKPLRHLRNWVGLATTSTVVVVMLALTPPVIPCDCVIPGLTEVFPTDGMTDVPVDSWIWLHNPLGSSSPVSVTSSAGVELEPVDLEIGSRLVALRPRNAWPSESTVRLKATQERSSDLPIEFEFRTGKRKSAEEPPPDLPRVTDMTEISEGGGCLGGSSCGDATHVRSQSYADAHVRVGGAPTAGCRRGCGGGRGTVAAARRPDEMAAILTTGLRTSDGLPLEARGIIKHLDEATGREAETLRLLLPALLWALMSPVASSGPVSRGWTSPMNVASAASATSVASVASVASQMHAPYVPSGPQTCAPSCPEGFMGISG